MEKLDCKSLMIGDWVSIGASNYYQVEEIRKECGEYRFYLKGTSVFATESEIEPIPLITEFLEANGFTDVKYPRYNERTLHHIIDGYCVKINVANKDVNMIITPLAERTLVRRRADFILPNPDYVHELQDALRLCGIKKEIEL